MLRLRVEGLAGRRQPIELAGHALLPVAAGALYWEAEDTLLVADLHLEKGAAFAARGMMLPPYDTRSTLSRLAACIDVFRPRRVVALGDSFHRSELAGRLHAEDRDELSALQQGREWYWILGNHDPDLPESIGGFICRSLTIGGVTLCHEPSFGRSAEIAGHLHPVARIARKRPVLAGMMLGFLLARAGVDVVVLEKHADFLRDFRGDTIHPSTLEIMHELGLLDEFLKRPHQELRELAGQIGEDRVVLADFSHLPTRCRFIAFMPQWDFLDFLADEAKAYPSFSLRMQTEVTDLVQDGDTVVGVRAKVPEGTLDVQADLVVGADGRHSAVRDLAGLEVEDLGAPMDALWMRLSKRPEDGTVVLGRIQAGHLFVMLNRSDYWQCAFVIPKGGFADLRRRGLPAFRAEIVKLNPALANRVQEIKSWDDVKLLTVRVDRLKRWYKPGVLCIGDAAHAMSPVGGVGINLAVQDAVAAANILTVPLQKGPVPVELLAKVQRRREWPTRMTQAVQIFVQNRVISNVLAMQTQPRAPFAVKLLNQYPWLRRLPARLIGMGFRPEHVQSPELKQG